MIKLVFSAFALGLVTCATPQALNEQKPQTPTPDLLIGAWDVSLYFSPDAPPSSTTFVVTEIANGAMEGSFYGSAFSESGVTVFEDEVLFTAMTADGTGPYLHSGRLSESADRIEGQTLSTGRDFLMAWTAVRAADEGE